RRAGVAVNANVDQHNQLSGLAEDCGLLDCAFERRVTTWTGASCSPAWRGRGIGECRVGLRRCGGRRLCRTRRAFGFGRLLSVAEAGRSESYDRHEHCKVCGDFHAVRLRDECLLPMCRYAVYVKSFGG